MKYAKRQREASKEALIVDVIKTKLFLRVKNQILIIYNMVSLKK
jgi:hypothetical protein